MSEEFSTIGKRVPRIDALEKVTGEAKYCADLDFPGMLWGKIKRSPLPFAKILGLNKTRAERIIGVKAVVTAEDTPKIPYGTFVADELALAATLVRFVGDPVAAVAACDEDTAQEALDLIQVDYEPLPPVLDPEEAMQPEAPSVHPELGHIKNNIAYHLDYVRGDPDGAFAQADLIVEDRFETQVVHQAYLEPQACVSHFGSSNRLTVWGSLQSPFRARTWLAKALCMGEHQIRIIQPFVGGGFGGKSSGGIHSLYPISAFLARKSGRPVKIVYTYREELISGRPRLSEVIFLKLGVTKTGRIIGKELHIIGDGGAYTVVSPTMLGNSVVRTGSLYRIQNIRAVGDLVYTNKVPKGPFRGMGNPQMHFAMESLLDEAASKLNIDPRDLRLTNATRAGDTTAQGAIINSCGLTESIERACSDSGWKEKRKTGNKSRGIGIGCHIHVSSNRALHPLYDGSSAMVTLNEHGKVKVISGEGEIGQGASTVFAQITGEELCLPIEDIQVLPVDTDLSPYCSGAFASRVTTMGGSAVKLAAKNLRKELLKSAAKLFESNASDFGMEDLEIKDGWISLRNSNGKGLSVQEVASQEVFRRGGGPLTGIGNYKVPDWVVLPNRNTLYGNVSLGYPFGTQIAEVEVDLETGMVEVIGIWAAHDLGRAINPTAAEGQIEGGIAQGIGYAFTESYIWQKGHLMNATFTDYRIPTALDIPPMHVSLIESNDPHTPYGAKGLGEPALISTAPAIANAIFHATGIRIKELPITAEKILKALRKRGVEGGKDVVL